jgi:uncharacterized membrane protein YgcG
MKGWRLAVAVLWAFFPARAAEDQDHRCFDDRAGVLSSAHKARLRDACARAYKEGAGLMVVTLRSLDDLNPRPLRLERVVEEMYEEWDIDYERGRLGILLFVPVKEREFRVMLGDDYSDSRRNLAVTLIRQILVPAARRNAIGAGICELQKAYLDRILLPQVKEKKRKEKKRQPTITDD